MKLLKKYSTLDEAINYLTHETGSPVDLDYLIELEKEGRLKMLVDYHGEVNIITNKITSSSTKFNDKTVSKYIEAIFEPTQRSVLEKDIKLLLGDEDSIYNYQYFVVHRLFSDPNFIPTFTISSNTYIDIEKPITVKFDREQVTKDDIRISSSELTKIIENFSYHELQKELENLKIEYSNITEQLTVAKAELINKLTNDEPTHHKAVNSMATLIATLLKLASYDKQDLENPHGNINKEIIAKAEGLDLTLGKDFIAKWLTKADDVL